ncbi:hypothetical protein V1525DRAFT_380567 [Lipomyces kononenkoae]|uniref:Uncharacterized protein n=1 Tax=Lipomyces kononenkoae TaxID=34357 RepID=A0ACC3SW62_LIPKO
MGTLSSSTTASRYLADLFNYFCRCIPGISTLLVIAVVVFGNDTLAFVVLTLVYHVLIVAHTARNCYGVYATWKGMLETANRPGQHSESAVSSNEPNLTTQIIEHDSRTLIHAIIVANYNEHLDTLRETLSMLASHDMAHSSYEVYLAMEAQEQGAELKAMTLISEFGQFFRYFTYTVHPLDLPGEARGKSSNLAFSARVASNRYIKLRQSNVVLTTMDADSHFLSSYFEMISTYCASKGTDNFTIFVPPIVFDRNSDNVSPLVRCADKFWSAAGIAGLFENSTVKIPTSVFSITMALARYVEFWDTGPEAIGDELHMYLKCFFQTGGQLNTVPIYSPVSQCNVEHGDVTADMTVGQRWILSSQARFKQASRHMWGIMDSGYATRHALSLLMSQSSTTDRSAFTGEKASATTPTNLPESIQPGKVMGPLLYYRTAIVVHRVYEAHFLHVHYFIDGLACFLLPLVTTVPRSSVVGRVLVYASYLRTIAFYGGLVQMLLYERLYFAARDLRRRFIQAALSSRWSHIPSVGQASAKSVDVVRQSLQQVDISRHSSWIGFLDCLLLPVAGAFYVIIPSLKAQLLQFWSIDFVFEVSSKPVKSK